MQSNFRRSLSAMSSLSLFVVRASSACLITSRYLAIILSSSAHWSHILAHRWMGGGNERLSVIDIAREMTDDTGATGRPVFGSATSKKQNAPLKRTRHQAELHSLGGAA
jgi:hypothetical protein